MLSKPAKEAAAAAVGVPAGHLAIDSSDRDSETVKMVHLCKYCSGTHTSLRRPYREATRADDSDAAGRRMLQAASGQRRLPGGEIAVIGGPKPPKTRIRITNLADDVVEEEIHELCRGYGRVSRAHITRHRESGCVTGAYVEFDTEAEAEAAKASLDGCAFKYLLLKVEWADRKSVV